jgi:hypothetical protein
MRGRGDGVFCRGCGGGRGGGRGNGNKISCQVCGKTSHTVLHCYKRFDASYNSEDKHANAATMGYNVDTDWYTELDKLTVRVKYGGSNQAHTVSGSGMTICYVGQSTIHTHDHDLVLKDILHVPSSSKNLVSIHKFIYDNNAFFEFHPWYFLLKDRDMNNLLLQGRCRSRLYPLLVVAWSSKSPNKHVLVTTKPSLERLHHQLGHASLPIDQRVISRNNLSCLKEISNASVCDASQKVKSHQLSFPKSFSESKAPLELIFSYVWGPAPTSVGHFKYYVSFIGDYSKYTWVYLLKNKSDVFHKFHEFQKLVERQFDKKILAIQSD